MFGCSQDDVPKTAGNFKTQLLEKTVGRFSLDTVPMKRITLSESSTFVDAVKKSLDIGSLTPILPHCDTLIVFFVITSEKTYNSVVKRDDAIAMLNETLSDVFVDTSTFYKSNEPLEDGSLFYKLILDITYNYEKMQMVIGFVMSNGKINSIYLY
jgi:hypothetical protein